MKISRRDFVARTSVSAMGLSFFPSTGFESVHPQTERSLDCVLVDLQSDCLLRESLQGYRRALADDCSNFATVRSDWQLRCRMAIVPGAGLRHPSTRQLLLSLLQAGTHLVLESGAGFLPPDEFAAHQKSLRQCFGLSIKPLLHVWGPSGGDRSLRHSYRSKTQDIGESIPYINYTWPRQAIVRDFSRVIPVCLNDEDVIARVGPVPVGLKKTLWNGTLIFLGSPLGPALLAGDLQARSWLRSVTKLDASTNLRSASSSQPTHSM
jgi:hypothetical protein